jgi:pimeloyl-ACP methyl ester carboxylesterase
MANGTNHINFVVRGTDNPTLIFVHGFACSLDYWEKQFRGLSSRFRCVALDLPGHGDSRGGGWSFRETRKAEPAHI